AAARALSLRLKDLAHPLAKLAYLLRALIAAKSDELDTAQRARIEAVARGLERRAKIILPAWILMLDTLETSERRVDGRGVSQGFADWSEVEREAGRAVDVGMRRHWIDPTAPLASEVLVPSHGALITSATLRDPSDGEDGASADARPGANHLA